MEGTLVRDRVRNYSGTGPRWELWEAIRKYGEAKEGYGYGESSLKELEEAEDRIFELLNRR